MDETGWIIVIFMAGFVAMIVELFLPGAVLGTIGFLVCCGAIVYAFVTGHPVMGGVMIGAIVAMLPVFFIIWREVLGRFWALKDTIGGSSAPSEASPDLVGKEGEAISTLRPSGVALIEGRRRAVITRGEMLDKGTRVRVIEVSGGRIVVKKA